MSTPPPISLTPAMLNFAETASWKEILRQALNDLRVAIPAIVQDFDEATQSCTVQVALREVVRTPTGPQNVVIMNIYKVPVQFPSAGGFSVTLPVSQGDEGLLVFCDMCIDLWYTRGGVQNQLERRRHDLTDCVFIPGIKSNPEALGNYSTDSLQIRSDDGNTVIDVAESGVTITAQKLTINSSGDIDLTATGNVNIMGAAVNIGNPTTIDGQSFLPHTHSGVQTGGGNTGPVT